MNTGAQLRAAGQMETWELMALVIPRGEAERIARLMNYSPDYVRRWQRPRETGDDDDGSRRDPVANLLILFDALRARKRPQDIALIMDYIKSDLASGSEVDGQPSVVTRAQAESELRAASARFAEIADMLARSDAHENDR